MKNFIWEMTSEVEKETTECTLPSWINWYL